VGLGGVWGGGGGGGVSEWSSIFILFTPSYHTTHTTKAEPRAQEFTPASTAQVRGQKTKGCSEEDDFFCFAPEHPACIAAGTRRC